jgi:uncharacterized damage-inducible protein DinB
MVQDIQDPRRSEPAMDGLPERDMLEGWLEFHRTTLLIKAEGLEDETRKSRPIASSKLSLHGLLRHMAEVERCWFRRTLQSDHAAPYIWADATIDDSEMVPLDDANWEADVQAWEDECERSREAAATRHLDDSGVTSDGALCSLRWIYTHMIEEYARHNGHADLIRELLDGAVGY